MKRIAVVLLLMLVVNVAGGCRFAVVEDDPVNLGSLFSASAEEKPLKLWAIDNGKDTRVRDMQARLKELGYFSGKVDGIFGLKTQDALKAFQEAEGIEATGKLDHDTTYALYPERRTLAEATEKTAAALEGVDSGVKQVQEALARYGFTEARPTGAFDEATMDAVKAFQHYAVEHYGTQFDEPLPESALLEEPELLPMDAPVPTPTPETAIPEMVAPTPEPTVRPDYEIDGAVSENLYGYLTSGRFPVFRGALQYGDAGEEVLRLQRRLANLGFYYDEINGEYNDFTLNAVKGFQAHSGLQETGIASEDTQRLMFSANAVPLEDVKKPFYIKVSEADQRVYIYRWMDGEYNYLVKTMICSTGAEDTPSPKGVFVSSGYADGPWHHFYAFNCWAQYPFVIVGNVWFHSVLFSQKDEDTVRQLSVDMLGQRASHGCVRLTVEDAKWIYEHCSRGQIIEVY